VLENIHSSQDLRKIPLEQLPQLCQEIRTRIIEVVSTTGGHLASSLGSVELTVALHYVLNTPTDKIIWDVGHQAYTHKIISGRNKDFTCLRQYKGLSGFPCKDESVYDPFTTGHSSTAVSLALGLACARDIAAAEHFKIAAVIGDGSLSGGLCFEGLNNAGHLKKDLLVVLNTNEMSIAPNVGAISTYLNKLISLPVYNRFRNSLENLLKARFPKGSRLIKLANKFEEGLKGLFIPGMLFEELGFRYFGPFDGNNLVTLIPALRKIIDFKGPIILHAVTKKGKGYPPAEKDPVRFHSAAPFNIETGESTAKLTQGKTYTQIFSESLVEFAEDNKDVTAITAAMPEGTGLDKFRDAYPERFFDVGIAEEHAVCFAAGLARCGFKPVVAIYSTFLQRAYDQIIECCALQKLGVIFALDRSGVVGGDGPTHQGVFDITFLSSIPNVIVMAPKDGQELKLMLEFAIGLYQPVAIRYPKALCPQIKFTCAQIELGSPELLEEEGEDFILISLGSLTAVAKEAMELLKKDNRKGILVNARFAKPLDKNFYTKICSRSKNIFTVEDGVIAGGFGSILGELLGVPITNLGVPDEFVPCGKRDILLNKYGLDAQSIASVIKTKISGK